MWFLDDIRASRDHRRIIEENIRKLTEQVLFIIVGTTGVDIFGKLIRESGFYGIKAQAVLSSGEDEVRIPDIDNREILWISHKGMGRDAKKG